ncbi:MAG: MBL fold metallo-hydrolase [bacterium]
MSDWMRDGRYHNLDGTSLPGPGSAGRVLKWKLGRRAPATLDAGLNRPPRPLRPALAPAPFQLTWLGHATWLIQIDGVTALTDPTFTGIGPARAIKRLTPAPLPLADLPPVDVIAVSHNHYDHCDLPSLRALRARFPDAPFLVPAGLDAWLRRKLGDPVIPLPWWTAHAVGPLSVHAVPAQHWSTRGGGTNTSHWCGFVFAGPAGSAYFAGDTGDGDHFAAIAARHPLDAALLPIGAYAPRWFMQRQHIGPWEAIAAARTLRAHLLPMHWGTYQLTDEPLDEPPRLTQSLIEGHPMTLLRPGGTWTPHGATGVFQWPDDLMG